MSENNQMTHSEHYIPQMYFRQFSENKKNIYRYDVNALDKPPEIRSIDKICREIDMYEPIYEDGSYIAPNHIENRFGRIETKAGKVIEAIKAKAQNDKCLSCTSVLSDEDKSILNIFITALMFRDPDTIEFGIKSLQATNPDIDLREARNYTLYNLLPLGVNREWDENTVIRTATERLSGMAFQIGIADEDVIITSDRPFVVWPPDENELYNRPKALAFPLTSRLLLYLFAMNEVEAINSSFFIRLSENQINDIQENVTVCAKKWLYSRNPLTEEQMNRVKSARNRLLNSNSQYQQKTW